MALAGADAVCPWWWGRSDSESESESREKKAAGSGVTACTQRSAELPHIARFCGKVSDWHWCSARLCTQERCTQRCSACSLARLQQAAWYVLSTQLGSRDKPGDWLQLPCSHALLQRSERARRHAPCVSCRGCATSGGGDSGGSASGMLATLSCSRQQAVTCSPLLPQLRCMCARLASVITAGSLHSNAQLAQQA